jgi:hypothetical protein
LGSPLERRDLCAVRIRGFLEARDLAADFFSSDAGDFAFEDGGNVWHGPIVQRRWVKFRQKIGRRPA